MANRKFAVRSGGITGPLEDRQNTGRSTVRAIICYHIIGKVIRQRVIKRSADALIFGNIDRKTDGFTGCCCIRNSNWCKTFLLIGWYSGLIPRVFVSEDEYPNLPDDFL